LETATAVTGFESIISSATAIENSGVGMGLFNA
jgi:hypothetical protein